MKYTLYTGCSVPVNAPHYELSARKVCDFLNLELESLNTLCCGNPIAPINEQEAAKMASYLLGLASERGNPVMTLCNTCTSSLLKAQKNLDKKLLEKYNFDAKKVKNLKIKHFITILHEDIGVESINSQIKIRLNAPVAVHYGCHFYRPSYLYTEDPEYPTSLDELVEICGTCSVPYKKKSMCCGFPLAGINFDISLQMTGKKLLDIKDKADIMVVTCAGCGFMFDGKQKSAEAVVGEQLNIPVLYYSQVLGLAFGIPPDELGFSMNRVRVTAFLEKVLP